MVTDVKVYKRTRGRGGHGIIQCNGGLLGCGGVGSIILRIHGVGDEGWMYCQYHLIDVSNIFPCIKKQGVRHNFQPQSLLPTYSFLILIHNYISLRY